MQLLNRLVAAALPELARHLHEIRLPLDLFATQWLVSLFSAALPPPSVARVWDWLFLDGPPSLLCVALALLRRCQHRLRATDDLQVVTTKHFLFCNIWFLMCCCCLVSLPKTYY